MRGFSLYFSEKFSSDLLISALFILRLMAAIAPWLVLREAAAAELEISFGLDHVSISINKICRPGKANRATLWINEDLGIFAHR